MQRKKFLFVSVGILIVGLFSFSFLKSNINIQKERLLKEVIFGTLSQAHYHMPEINDNFSEKAFDMYLNNIDHNKRFFTLKDVKELKAFRDKIDDDIHGSEKANLYRESVNILLERIRQTKGYYQEVLSKPFDFSEKEKLQLDAEKREFCSNEKQLKERWRKTLKYRALVQYYNRMDAQERRLKESNKPKEEEIKSPQVIEKEVREQIVKNLNNSFDLIDKLDNDDRFASYINAILNIFGPHTEYFPPEEKAAFDIRMSGQLEGIGAILRQSDGYIRVERLVAGGPAWKQGELKAKDIILKVAQDGEKEVAISDMALKDAVKLIKGPKNTRVYLTIRKPDGRIQVISIIRDIVVIEATYAKSAVIDDSETGQKYGYIYLPSFYADFSKKNGRNCAEDVKKEIIKLKKQNIAGIILDIRNNGGGSLSDVVKMAGLFIEEGPIVQVKNRIQTATVLKDTDPNIYYNGPLAILLNKASASASEIMSAAMQDYSRAVIIGGPTTYGKGSVQRFIDLDQLLPEAYNSVKPLGQLKLTIQQFYRITGKAIQAKGVSADVELPYIYQHVNFGEKFAKYALPWGEIESTQFNKWSDEKFDLQAFTANSQSRTQNTIGFKLIKENAIYLKEQNEASLQSLHYATFKEEQRMMHEKTDEYSNENYISKSFSITSMQDHSEDSEIEKIKSEEIKTWTESVQKDLYIKEATSVLNDWINNKKVSKK